MSYLLDTNVLSELQRRNPDAHVVLWFSERPASTLFLSVLTLGELRKGIEGLAENTRKLALLDWLETKLPAFFSGRILPVDNQVAELWGRFMAQAGRSLPAIDSLLAATALTHDLTLVTRKLRDFLHPDMKVINP